MRGLVLQSIEERLNELEQYEVDDEYLLQPMSRLAATSALLILKVLNLEQRPGIFRMPDGGVSIEWINEDTFVGIEISPDGSAQPEFFWTFWPEGATLTQQPEERILARSPYERKSS